jgi:hypothetical protein
MITHARNARIRFVAHSHSYAIAKEGDVLFLSEGIRSVTTVVSGLSDPFEKKAGVIAAVLARNQRTKERAFLGANEELAKEMESIHDWRQRREIMLRHGMGEYSGYWDGSMIRLHWDEQRDLGTELHAEIEQFLQGKPGIAPEKWHSTKEWGQVLDFFTQYPKEEFCASEWRVFHEDFKLAGSFDALRATKRDADGNVTNAQLLDWKRAKNIWKVLPECFNVSPLTGVKISDVHKYSIQMHLYRFILEQKYGIKIDDMYIVAFHPNYDKFQMIRVEDTLPGCPHPIQDILPHLLDPVKYPLPAPIENPRVQALRKRKQCKADSLADNASLSTEPPATAPCPSSRAPSPESLPPADKAEPTNAE